MRKLQEYLLQKDKPLEMAILPEDKIQHLLVGVTISILLLTSEFALSPWNFPHLFNSTLSIIGLQPTRTSNTH